MEPCISYVTNRGLTKAFSSDEVRATFFGMSPHMAPGKDGFYKRFWGTVGKNITDICLGILNKKKSF